MSYQKVDPAKGGTTDFPPTIRMTEAEPGTTYEGVYEGTREIPNKFDQNKMWRIHSFTLDGAAEPTEFWGFTQLDRCMAQVPDGARVRIKYLGKQKVETSRGPVVMQAVEVEADAEDVQAPAERPSDDEIPF